MTIETPEFKHEAAKMAFQKTVEAFSATLPNTEGEFRIAQRLIESLIFHWFGFRLEDADWAPHIGEIRKAAEIIAESFIKEAREGGMAPEEARRRLGLMIENGFIDPARNPLVKSFVERSA